jgi:hypothetical protein
MMEPDKWTTGLLANLLADTKLKRKETEEKRIKECARVIIKFQICIRCTSCMVEIFQKGRCNGCRTCAQQMSQDENCGSARTRRRNGWGPRRWEKIPGTLLWFPGIFSHETQSGEMEDPLQRANRRI